VGTLRTSRWDHLAVIRSGTTLILYVNGQNVGSTTVSGQTNTGTGMLAFGRAGSFAGYYYNGGVDEVAIYNKALSPARSRRTTRQLVAWCHRLPDADAHGGRPGGAGRRRHRLRPGRQLLQGRRRHERGLPLDANGGYDAAHGVVEIVVGTGGRNLRTFNGIVANSVVRSDIAFGVLRITLHDNSYEWQFLPDGQSGGFADAGSSSCH
jgi:hypothetical protein